jgi:hypothetical protein
VKLSLITAILCLAPAAFAATTWYVNGPKGKDSNDCLSLSNACKTIGHAISLAASGDTISIAAATYHENPSINVNLTLIGAHAATTIIDGRGLTHTVSILNAAISVTIKKLTIRHGAAAGGGGIINWGTLTLANSTVTENAAVSSYSATGAGIYNSGTLILTSSTISGNGGSTNFIYGGGIFNSGTLIINNSTISGNSASGFTGGGGGGIYMSAGTATISSSTIADNTGTPFGGGINNSGATVTVKNTILANNSTGGNCYGSMTSQSYNLSSDGTCNFAGTGDMNFIDPLLGPLQNNGGQTFTQALPSGSPAIDAGNPSGCTDNKGHLLKTDQRGQPRHDPEDTSGCDIGAYESQSD